MNNKYMFLFAFLISCQESKVDESETFQRKYLEQSVYHDCYKGYCTEMITPHVHSQYLKWEYSKEFCDKYDDFALLGVNCEYSKNEAYCFVNTGNSFVDKEPYKSFTYYCSEYNCNIINEYEACNLR